MLESIKQTAHIEIQKSLLTRIEMRVVKPQKIELPKLHAQKIL